MHDGMQYEVLKIRPSVPYGANFLLNIAAYLASCNIHYSEMSDKVFSSFHKMQIFTESEAQ